MNNYLSTDHEIEEVKQEENNSQQDNSNATLEPADTQDFLEGEHCPNEREFNRRMKKKNG